MKRQIKEMFELQFKLTTSINGDKWNTGITFDGKLINWKRCIYMEIVEAISTIPWQQWKDIKGGIDYDKFRLEIVDIWSFIMSYLLT